MITTIIITALVSVIITVVFGYFIWSGIGVRKLKKQVKDNSNNLIGNAESIKILETILFEKVDEIYNNMSINSDDVHKSINIQDDGVCQKLDDLHEILNTQDDDIHRELDKRFDKVYQTISQQKQ